MNGYVFLNVSDVAWPIAALLIALTACYTAWCIAERSLMSHQIHQELVSQIGKLTSEFSVLREHHHGVTDAHQATLEHQMKKLSDLEGEMVDTQKTLDALPDVNALSHRFDNVLGATERQSVQIAEVDERHKQAAVQLLATIREGLDKVTTAQAAVYQQANVAMPPRRKFQP